MLARIEQRARHRAIRRHRERFGIGWNPSPSPNYTYACPDEELTNIEPKSDAAASVGLPSVLCRRRSAAFWSRRRVRFSDSAEFHRSSTCRARARACRTVDADLRTHPRARDNPRYPLKVKTSGGPGLRPEHFIVRDALTVFRRALFFALTHPEPLMRRGPARRQHPRGIVHQRVRPRPLA